MVSAWAINIMYSSGSMVLVVFVRGLMLFVVVLKLSIYSVRLRCS
mgnify:FL=1|jgi:hypothetical protein